MARHLGQQEIDRLAATGRAELELERAKRQGEQPDAVNLENALDLGEPLILPGRWSEYRAGSISVMDALRLQRIHLRYMKPSVGTPTEEDIDAFEALYLETVNLFCSLLSPKPATNPFTDLLPQEIGALLGFFFMCLTVQNRRVPQNNHSGVT